MAHLGTGIWAPALIGGGAVGIAAGALSIYTARQRDISPTKAGLALAGVGTLSLFASAALSLSRPLRVLSPIGVGISTATLGTGLLAASMG